MSSILVLLTALLAFSEKTLVVKALSSTLPFILFSIQLQRMSERISMLLIKTEKPAMVN